MADKYDDLFGFYIKLYDDEIARFRGLDTKIGRYLSAYPILIALTGFVGVNLRFLLGSSGLNLWVLANYICLACVFVAYTVGFYYLISALKMENLQRFAYGDSVIEFFLKHQPINIKYALARRAKEAIEHNVSLGNRKSEKIAKAINWSFSLPTMAFLAASVLLAIGNVYFASDTSQMKNGTSVSNSIQMLIDRQDDTNEESK